MLSYLTYIILPTHSFFSEKLRLYLKIYKGIHLYVQQFYANKLCINIILKSVDLVVKAFVINHIEVEGKQYSDWNVSEAN